VARDKVAEEIIRRDSERRSSRATWEVLWQSIARYCLPNEASFMEQVNPGQDRMRWVLDSTAPRALEMFGSFLHTLLNSPTSQWIKFGIEGTSELAWSPAVRAYLEALDRKVMALLSAPMADIYSQLHQTYLNLGAFGTAVMYMDTVNRQLRIRTYHLDDCTIEEGEDETIDSLSRQRTQSKRAALQRFDAEKLGRAFANLNDEKLSTKDRYVHAVFPATDPIVEQLPKRRTARGSAYYSAWVLDGEEKKVLEYGSYNTFPYMVPRWYKARGEIYGRSPAMTAMPDIRMVNRMSDTILRGAEKIVDPPLVVPDGAIVSPVRLYPGGLTFVEGGAEIKSLIPPGTSRIETGNQLLIARQQAIKEAFFTPLFVTPDSPVKTATQVMQEVDERNRALSPMLVRMQSELFSRIAMRALDILAAAGQLPLPPAELQNTGALKLEYVSPLIASQKQLEGLALARTFEQMSFWAQVDQGFFDWIDTDKVAQRIPLANGVDATFIKSETVVKNVRKARAEQEALAAQAAVAPDAMKGAAAMMTAGAQVTKANASG
jgi:hypothetical protein